MRESATAWVGLLLLGLSLGLPPSGAQVNDLDLHAPILIAGDADLCNGPDLQEGADDADGIVNCDTADGSPERPYLITNWALDLDARSCPECTPPPCPGQSTSAILAVCGVTKHLRIDHVRISGHGPVVAGVPLPVPAPGVSNFAGLFVNGSTNVTVADATIATDRAALTILESPRTNALATPNVAFERVVLRSLAKDQAAIDPETAASLVRIANADVRLTDVHLDAAPRAYGLSLEDLRLDPRRRHAVTIDGGSFSNASLSAVRADGVQLDITGAIFSEGSLQGTPSGPDLPALLALSRQRVHLEDNEYRFRTTALLFEDVVGSVVRNRFAASDAEALTVDNQGPSCGVLVNYNSFAGTPDLSTSPPTCSFDARFNWWGANTAPTPDQLGDNAGRVLYEPWLHVPVDDLPTVFIDLPPAQSQVYGTLQLTGRAVSGGAPVESVEITDEEGAWDSGRRADGTDRWSVVWDTDPIGLGPFTLWLRACSPLDCGLPVRHDLELVDRPSPPLALFDVVPHVARTGDVLRFQAIDSYSPSGAAIDQYQFDFGNGNNSGWLGAATTEFVYSEAGVYSTSLQVRDANNLTSNNAPIVVLRIQGIDAKDTGATPGLGLLAALAILALAASARRTR